jgi:hypothetical protein
MNDKIDNSIPRLLEEMNSDDENQSQELFDYYKNCATPERTVVNDTVIYLCGWSFETLLEKCGIKVDERGEPLDC